MRYRCAHLHARAVQIHAVRISIYLRILEFMMLMSIRARHFQMHFHGAQVRAHVRERISIYPRILVSSCRADARLHVCARPVQQPAHSR